MKLCLLITSLFIFLLTACNSEPAASSMEEVIEVKNEDGSARKASYYDKENHEKLLEREFYPGKKTFREWSYKGELKNGEARSYRENGTVWSLNTYRNDTLHGPYKTWHENGAIYMEGQYEMGEKMGVWKFYSPEGELVKTFDFSVMDSTTMRN